MSPRLKTEIWIQAMFRQLGTTNHSAVLVRRGDRDAGRVMITLCDLQNKMMVLQQVNNSEGELVWRRGTGNEPVTAQEADIYLKRHIERDPDLWIIEVETRDFSLPFEGILI
ncbi:MAG: DUF1491 family protein [Commensalibacter sp.]|nr:DUF1491 family protein [Commensalibacter sp.]